MSIESQKTMFRISKKLEDCFKQISLFACHFIVKSSRERDQYLTEFKRLTGKDENDRKRKEKIKHKSEKEKIRYEIHREKKKSKDEEHKEQKTKYKMKEDNNKQQRIVLEGYEKQIQKERSKEKIKYLQREKQREKQKYKSKEKLLPTTQRQKLILKQKQHLIRQKIAEKNKQKQIIDKTKQKNEKQNKLNEQIKQLNTNKSHNKVSQLQKQRQKDFQVESESKYAAKDYIIFQQDQSQEQSAIKYPSKKPQTQWSKRQITQIGSKDPKKYKILQLDQRNSDFQDQNAPLKVPQVKPREPLTAYFLFLRRNRHYISKKVSALGNNASVSLFNIWKNLDEEQKRPYLEEYKRAAKLYAEKLRLYNAHTMKQGQGQDGNGNERDARRQ